jgi:hypothetical protein
MQVFAEEPVGAKQEWYTSFEEDALRLAGQVDLDPMVEAQGGSSGWKLHVW